MAEYPMNAIEFQHISFQYSDGNELVLRDINASIPYGSITLLTGRTGVGKTTLLRILTRVIPEDVPGIIHGNILVDGETIAKQSVVDIAKKVGFVMQDPECQIFHETVHDELLFGMENISIPKNEAYEREKEALDKIKIGQDRKNKTLSGGQKAMLITQSVLLMHQNILILDEPLANLDLENALKLLNFLKHEAEKGKAIIICEHRTSLVLPYCDNIYHIEDGMMLEGTGDYDKPFSSVPKNVKQEITEEKHILKAKNITKKFDDQTILDGLNLTLKPKTITVILGTNGQGKTTLLNTLSGQSKIKKNEGTIDQSVCRKIGSRKWFKNIGVVFQNPTYELFSSSVRKELCFHSYSQEFAMDMGRRLKLEYLYDRHPQSLSEGEKRRLTIACALARKPSILFLDEPTVGQDRKSLETIIETLLEYVKQYDASIYLVTHDEQAAKALADESYILRNGKLTSIEKVEDFFSELRSLSTENKNNNI